jgi:hypothetical protein
VKNISEKDKGDWGDIFRCLGVFLSLFPLSRKSYINNAIMPIKIERKLPKHYDDTKKIVLRVIKTIIPVHRFRFFYLILP